MTQYIKEPRVLRAATAVSAIDTDVGDPLDVSGLLWAQAVVEFAPADVIAPGAGSLILLQGSLAASDPAEWHTLRRLRCGNLIADHWRLSDAASDRRQ
jgi:hypothetical protein